MLIRPALIVGTLCLLLSACASTPKLPKGQHVGEPMEARKAMNFAVVDATPTRFFNQTLLVEATVMAVCANKGCWMQIDDQGKVAMVRWETGCGGKYAFPMDSVGKRVLIQGSFYPKKISAEDAQHLEEEAGSQKLVVKRDGYEFNASAVMILPASAPKKQ